MIKILHIVSSLSTGSGVMNFIMNYYRKIDKNKVQFDFVFWENSELNFKNEIEKLGGSVYKIEKPCVSFKFFKIISKFFKKHSSKYIAVHCHPIFSFVFISYFAKKNGIKHIIQHSHTTKLSRNFVGKIRNSLILNLAPLFVTEYAACSHEALQLLPKKDLRKKQSIILNNAIDFNKYYYDEADRIDIRKKYNISQNTIVIGHVGRFSEEKNHKLLLNVFKEYNKKNSDSLLLLLGDGPLKNQIISQLQILNIEDKVIMVGNVPDVGKYLSAMDYFVFPSIFEGFGLSVLEAEINGLFVICSNAIPDYAIISDKVFKCKSFNSKEFFNALMKYKPVNFNERNLKNVNDKFDINNQVLNLEKFYYSLD